MLVVIQHVRPDTFFTGKQQQRLDDLMLRWRIARDTASRRTDDEQFELRLLVEAGLEAARRRAEVTVPEIDYRLNALTKNAAI